jgi:hypothetical protein
LCDACACDVGIFLFEFPISPDVVIHFRFG